ncbi:MAG: ABC transporter permease [Actinomycetota bacterium]|nr:ABC transporter permease [Actinomycetota bacterium]
MIRLSLRQFRTQGWVAVGLLLMAAVMLGLTGPHLAQIYGDFAKSHAACATSGRCLQATIDIGKLDRLLELIGTALVAVPGLIGAFWGAPLISRELEHGTHRLAWTQSVSRTRWLAVKLALVGAASVAATGLLSLMVTWWSSPIDQSNMNRFDAGLFGERNITPVGYAAFGFALGVTAGVLIRRTLPAMATTLAVFLGVRLAFTYLIRPHLLTPVHATKSLESVAHGFGQTNGGPPTLFADADLPNSWIYSARIVDSSGHALTSQVVTTSCPDLLRPFAGPGSNGGTPVPAPADVQNAFQACITKLSPTYHGIVTYQPASRYWTFQYLEAAIFLAAALALAALCFYWIRRRTY